MAIGITIQASRACRPCFPGQQAILLIYLLFLSYSTKPQNLMMTVQPSKSANVVQPTNQQNVC